MLDYSKVRFLWRGDAGRKVSSGRYDKIYDMGPRAATGDATFATAATRPIVDELSDWYGLAVDPAATNLALRSQEFDNASWTKSNAGTALAPVVTPNVATAPDGTLTADLIVFDRGAGNTITDNSQFSQAVTVANATVYTASFFLKAATGADVGKQIGIRGVAGVGYGVITLTADWVRYTRTETSSSTSGSIQLGNRGTITTDNTVSVHAWQGQLELGSVATQPKKTEGTTTAYSAVVAPITDAIPVTGTIIVWDNMVNAYPSGYNARIFDSEDLSTTYVQLVKDLSSVNRLGIKVHNNTYVQSGDLQWQPSNQRKRWFFAMTFDGTNVDVYRGDVQGNIEKVIDTTYTPSTAAIRDIFLGSAFDSLAQIGASFLDIMTYDEVMTEAEIEDIYYGAIPVFQQTGYAGTFVDKFRQKVQAEPSSTYDTTLESTVLADWSEDIFGVYDADASAFFSRGFDDGATLENLDATNTFILALKAL